MIETSLAPVTTVAQTSTRKDNKVLGRELLLLQAHSSFQNEEQKGFSEGNQPQTTGTIGDWDLQRPASCLHCANTLRCKDCLQNHFDFSLHHGYQLRKSALAAECNRVSILVSRR